MTLGDPRQTSASTKAAKLASGELLAVRERQSRHRYAREVLPLVVSGLDDTHVIHILVEVGSNNDGANQLRAVLEDAIFNESLGRELNHIIGPQRIVVHGKESIRLCNKRDQELSVRKNILDVGVVPEALTSANIISTVEREHNVDAIHRPIHLHRSIRQVLDGVRAVSLLDTDKRLLPGSEVVSVDVNQFPELVAVGVDDNTNGTDLLSGSRGIPVTIVEQDGPGSIAIVRLDRGRVPLSVAGLDLHALAHVDDESFVGIGLVCAVHFVHFHGHAINTHIIHHSVKSTVSGLVDRKVVVTASRANLVVGSILAEGVRYAIRHEDTGSIGVEHEAVRVKNGTEVLPFIGECNRARCPGVASGVRHVL